MESNFSGLSLSDRAQLVWPWRIQSLAVIEDVFVSQAASRQGGGIASAQLRTWCGGEGAKTNYCDCLPYALLTSVFQLPGKEEEQGEGKGKRWFLRGCY